jgi:cell division protein FtsW
MTPLRNPFNAPFRIFLLTMALAITGVVMVYSSSASYADMQKRHEMARTAEGREALADKQTYHDPRYAAKQCSWLVMGLAAMLAAYLFDYTRLKDWSRYLLWGSVILLVLVFAPVVGKTMHTCSRWVHVGSFQIQPSELAKLALVIYMAGMLHDHHDKLKSFRYGVLPALGITAVVALLVVREPDIGAAGVIVGIVFLMWYIGGMRLLHLGGLVATTIPVFVIAVFKYPDRLRRILAFVAFLLNPAEAHSNAKTYQLIQGLTAIGSGGVHGVGLGNSMQKYFLTEQYSDFIFAITAEELGFYGGAFVILCFFLLVWEGWRISLRAPDYYSSLLASGLTLLLAINVVLNLMVVLGLAPTKGLVLPLLSYGGSNMVITFAALGILMSIGADVEREKELIRVREKVRPAPDLPRERRYRRPRRWFQWGRA